MLDISCLCASQVKFKLSLSDGVGQESESSFDFFLLWEPAHSLSRAQATNPPLCPTAITVLQNGQ